MKRVTPAAVLSLAIVTWLPSQLIAAQAGSEPVDLENPRAGQLSSRRLAEQQAVQAAQRHAPWNPQTGSPAIAARLARVQTLTPPSDEVFALVSVTDRKTGERAYFTRGEASTNWSDYVRHPDKAPAGEFYTEADDAEADDSVVTVTRSIARHERTVPSPSLDRGAEAERDQRLRNQDSGMHHRIESGLWQRLRSGAIDPRSSTVVPVTIALRGLPQLELPRARDLSQGGLLLTGLELSAARERAIIERKQRISNLHAGLRQQIEARSGTFRYGSWTSGQVRALVPASMIETLAARPEVSAIDYDEPEVFEDAFDGADVYVATQDDQFEATNSGFEGLSSKHSSTSRILIAVRDSCLDLTNPAFDTNSTGESRAEFYDCDEGASCPQGSVEDCADNLSSTGWHGTRVAQFALADFMDGQGTGLNPTDRRAMTGTCQECSLAFLQDEGLDDRDRAMDKACELGADIYSSSVSTVAADCDGNGSYDADIEALVDCDVMFVNGIGNGGSTGACTATYPGSHPWTLAVSGVDTNESDCDEASEWYAPACVIDASSSIGGGSYNNTYSAAIVDLAAPFRFAAAIEPGTRPVTYTAAAGNSYANPTVSGLTAVMMDWYNDNISDALFFGNAARNFMLLFGDRSKSDSGVDQTNGTTNKWWGAGRVGLVPFNQLSTWAIRRASATLDPNEAWIHTSTFNGNKTFYKAAIWHDGTDYNAEPRIRVDLNPGGAGCTAPIVSYERSDSKIVVAYDDPALLGCTSMTITVISLPEDGSGTRKFHFAHYATTQSERP